MRRNPVTSEMYAEWDRVNYAQRMAEQSKDYAATERAKAEVRRVYNEMQRMSRNMGARLQQETVSTRRRTSRGPRPPWLRRNAPKRPKMSEMEVWDSIGTVRTAGQKNHANTILPPGVAAEFKKRPPGLYKYGWGPKKGASFTKFTSATLKGAMTSTRIGASKVHEYHWLVDNFDPSFPVIVRGIDDRGVTFFRVEEYAKALIREREPAVLKRSDTAMKPKRTSR